MTEKEFLKAGKLIKQHNMDISQITKCVNLFLQETHVCEQEMVNYLARAVEMPEEVEQAFKDAFLASERITAVSYTHLVSFAFLLPFLHLLFPVFYRQNNILNLVVLC